MIVMNKLLEKKNWNPDALKAKVLALLRQPRSGGNTRLLLLLAVAAALVVLLGFLASGILGLVRTAAYTAYFGASHELDVFYGAQRIPEMLFTLIERRGS